ncbi:MAG: carboxylating nicotinate-nucleotide diphosphorylase [Mariniblastus sp.]|nr:carboxylating nicotinate-nucleotide diphosphorylase [Mariniblastus sp.]
MNQPFPFPLDARAQADALQLVELALLEDVGSPDLETAVDGTSQCLFSSPTPVTADFVARQAGIVCGLQVCQLAIERVAPGVDLEININDSEPVRAGQALARISGNAGEVLVLERTCLNILCHLSSISTMTGAFVERVAGTGARILDTRKTIPGWRRLEKYAVRCGGGSNHRMGLYDAIMIKDNHLAIHNQAVQDQQISLPESIRRARQWIEANASSLPDGLQTIVQIEVDTLEQLQVVLVAEPDIVLLDNMAPAQLKEAVDMRNRENGKVLLEASGGVNLETVRTIAESGVERISVGALTHSAGNFDIGLDWQPT